VKTLVTGGAGFIGSHLVDSLLEQGYQVRVLDNLHPQIHGGDRQLPDYFPHDAEFIFGDVLDEQVLTYALKDVDVVFHLAAQTGVGQSMYEAGGYARTNVTGTAVLWDAIQSVGGIQKVVLASSRAVYGEGTYLCGDCGRVRAQPRHPQGLAEGRWSPTCPHCGAPLRSVATTEKDQPLPTSVYGITKLSQEQLSLTLGCSYDIPVVALRFFNVFGSRQALSNPYTGILATFLARLRSDKPLLIYEDGQQIRDFVHVSDVVQACQLAAASEQANFQTLNVGSGQPISILELARKLLKLRNQDTENEGLKVTGHYRVGDIRDCYADITRARAQLGYEPRMSLLDGLREFSRWSDFQMLVDNTDEAFTELASAGLLRQERAP